MSNTPDTELADRIEAAFNAVRDSTSDLHRNALSGHLYALCYGSVSAIIAALRGIGLGKPSGVNSSGMLPCPFCGGECDPTGWVSADREGPACIQCNGAADAEGREDEYKRGYLDGHVAGKSEEWARGESAIRAEVAAIAQDAAAFAGRAKSLQMAIAEISRQGIERATHSTPPAATPLAADSLGAGVSTPQPSPPDIGAAGSLADRFEQAFNALQPSMDRGGRIAASARFHSIAFDDAPEIIRALRLASQQNIHAAVEAEREACAVLAESCAPAFLPSTVAAAIRARSK